MIYPSALVDEPAEAPVQVDVPRRRKYGGSTDHVSISQALSRARLVASFAAARAASIDFDGALPLADVDQLRDAGLLRAPLPPPFGGAQLGSEPGSLALCEVLRLLGSGNLSVGRLYEGHVNALGLIARYGTAAQKRRLFTDAQRGHLFGVWNTDCADAKLKHDVSENGFLFAGGKDFASGAGFVTRPLVTSLDGADPASSPLMFVVPLKSGERADLSAWKAHGMRASASGYVDFSGLRVGAAEQVGAPGDYSRQPYFSGGAWRFAAVQSGGIDAILDAWRAHLVATRRGEDPHQALRLGEGAIAAETARLWVERAASTASDATADCGQVLAYVGLARCAVEHCGLRVMELAQRSVGLRGFLRDHPLERLCRDLSTYLRQPGPDGALSGAAAHVFASSDSSGDLWRRCGEEQL